jgi:hypothetical protein
LDVIAVVGGYEEYVVRKRGTYTILHAPHNSIDFTGLVAILDLDLVQYASYMYIHDTTRAGPRFVQCVLDLPPDIKSASFRFPSMNMGLYSRSVVYESKDLIESFRNTDDTAVSRCKSRCVEMEDCVFKAHIKDHMFLSSSLPVVQGHPTPYYGGSSRLVEYYPDMDLYKIKANWYVKPTYELAL